MDRQTKRRVLNVVLYQTSPAQDEWASESTLKVVAVAHGSVPKGEFDDALDELEEEGKIESQDGKYRTCEGVTRMPHEGEIIR